MTQQRLIFDKDYENLAGKLIRFSDKNTRLIYRLYSKLIIKTPERLINVNNKNTRTLSTDVVLVTLMLTLSAALLLFSYFSVTVLLPVGGMVEIDEKNS